MSLCIDCGCAFCCDGTLYIRAPLEEADYPIHDAAFELERQDSVDQTQAFFKQPCKLCLNDQCSIHEKRRPAICGSYQCKLLASHAAGAVSTESASTLVENVKTLRDRLVPRLEDFVGAEKGYSLSQLTQMVAERLEAANTDIRPDAPPEMLLDLALMRVLLAKNFDSRFTKYTNEADKTQLAMANTADSAPSPAASSET